MSKVAGRRNSRIDAIGVVIECRSVGVANAIQLRNRRSTSRAGWSAMAGRAVISATCSNRSRSCVVPWSRCGRKCVAARPLPAVRAVEVVAIQAARAARQDYPANRDALEAVMASRTETPEADQALAHQGFLAAAQVERPAHRERTAVRAAQVDPAWVDFPAEAARAGHLVYRARPARPASRAVLAHLAQEHPVLREAQCRRHRRPHRSVGTRTTIQHLHEDGNTNEGPFGPSFHALLQ